MTADDKSTLKSISARLVPRDNAANSAIKNINLPINSTPKQLNMVVSSLTKTPESEFSYFINDIELKSSLWDFLEAHGLASEAVLSIVYEEKTPVWVVPVTRCSSALEGHSGAILAVRFSPDGSQLATASGDKTVRLWDLNTETPLFELKAHSGWVQSLCWSPDAAVLSSGCYGGEVCLWAPLKGSLLRKLGAHSNAVMDIAWQPFHIEGKAEKLATAGKDGGVKVWTKFSTSPLLSLSGHTAAVTSVCWGGSDRIYSASRDKTVRVWNASSGKLERVLKGHAHWVNHLSMNTSYAIRTGLYDINKKGIKKMSTGDTVAKSKKKYSDFLAKMGGDELLVTASDDNTAFLWKPLKSESCVLRLTGHQQAVSFARFSPDGRFIVTASFDKSVRLWRGRDGKFLKVFRGHVAAVFQVSWSADSRYFVTGSRDSTLKLWSPSDLKRKQNLPGHADEVYAVDWSPDGGKVASGGKDKVLRLWRN